jgi:predicted dehydrogenase
VAAVASRDRAKAERFAAEMDIARYYGSYEELLADPLPNSLHPEWSMRAAAAGKHVLCEKPLAVTSAEARAMFEAVYPVSLVRMLAQERPSRVTAWAQWTNTGVDRTLVGTLEFPSGLLAQISGSFATCVHRQALIAGSEGVLQTTFVNNPTTANPPVMHLRRGSGLDSAVEIIEVPATNGFLAEAESFAQLVRQGWQHCTGATPAESVDIMLTLDGLLHSARTGQSWASRPRIS